MESTRKKVSLFVEFQSKLDEEVADEAKKGNSRAQDHLISKYENFIKAEAKSYFLIGTDKEGIYQEGMVELYKVMRDFRSNRLASFKAFAELCITRRIMTAIEAATRQKHIPLDTYISLNKPIYGGESDRTLIDVLPGLKITDPEELIIGKEQLKHIEGEMAKVLSDLGTEVLQSYLNGKSYREIACGLDRQAKSIDNALRRVRRKLEKCLYAERQVTEFLSTNFLNNSKLYNWYIKL